TEEAPWMVMGDLQFWSASSFAHSLRSYARERGLGWYVASMLPILYTWPPSRRKHQLAPDVFVALVPEHSRSSFDVAVEGGFPPGADGGGPTTADAGAGRFGTAASRGGAAARGDRGRRTTARTGALPQSGHRVVRTASGWTPQPCAGLAVFTIGQSGRASFR